MSIWNKKSREQKVAGSNCRAKILRDVATFSTRDFLIFNFWKITLPFPTPFLQRAYSWLLLPLLDTWEVGSQPYIHRTLASFQHGACTRVVRDKTTDQLITQVMRERTGERMREDTPMWHRHSHNNTRNSHRDNWFMLVAVTRGDWRAVFILLSVHHCGAMHCTCCFTGFLVSSSTLHCCRPNASYQTRAEEEHEDWT